MPEAVIRKVYTYKDYMKFPEGSRIELIDGEIFDMSPAPSRAHQRIVTEIARKIGNYIENTGSGCEVYVSPFDVRFIGEGETDENNRNTVQPDISVICDKSKLDDKGCKGAPDIIIEVVSQSNSSMDYVKKLYLYERFKVREYWIVNPDTKSVLVYVLNSQGQYGEPGKYSFSDDIMVSIFDELKLKLGDILI